MMKKVIAGCLLVAASGLANASLIVTNGSFESPLQTSGTWSIYGSIPGWIGTPNGIEVRNNVVGSAYDGHNFVELDTTNNSTMSQTLTGLTAGAQYDLQWFYSPRIGQPITTNGISVYWNGTQLFNITQSGLPLSANNWAQLNSLVTAVAGPNVLKFAATGISDSLGGNIDMVSVNAVPLPAAAWLFGSAVLGLGALRRKQKAGDKSEMALA